MHPASSPPALPLPLLDLRLLATSDLHGHLLAWDHHSDRPAPGRGLSRVARLIGRARAEAGNCLLFDNGDFLNGSALADHLAEGPPIRDPHPMIAAMNHLAYDAAALGNHEFSHGLPYLRASLRGARFPLVCSNLHLGRPLAQPYAMLRRRWHDRAGRAHDLRVAVIGLLPPQTMLWERHHLAGRGRCDDILETARRLLPRLRQAGADLVIALSHSGIGAAPAAPGSENASLALAGLPWVDAVIAGHTHLLFPAAPGETLSGKPAVMPGFFGSHLGVIDLVLERAEAGWRVAGHQAALRPVAQREPGSGRLRGLVRDDPALRAIALADHAALRRRARLVIGQSRQRLHSYFALLSQAPALDLVARAKIAHVAAALQDGPHAGVPVVAAVAPFKAGGRGGPENYTDIPPGPLRLRHAADLYLHPNTVVALLVSGADLADWLERSVSLYHRILPGDHDVPLIDGAHPSFNFDMIHGLTYQIDLSQPARFDGRGQVVAPQAQRIVGLCHAGVAVAPDQPFVLVTNNYRSAAGFAGGPPLPVIHDAGATCRGVVERYLPQASTAGDGGAPVPWRFVPQGASVLFDTAPQAVAHLAEVPHLRLEPLAVQPSGFRRFRLRL